MPKKVLIVGLLTLSFFGQAPPAHGGHSSPAVVIEWNQLLQMHNPPISIQSPRYFAMMHIAMFDALNSIDPRYRPYRSRVRGAHGAAADVAAAQAAHDVLVALIPGSQAAFDTALAARIGTKPGWREAQAIRVGQQTARAVLEWRANDGWGATPPAYNPPDFPGLWEPAPPAFPPPGFTHFPGVVPFALLTATQYLPPPPPMLDSPEYAADFNEVKDVGRKTGSTRSTEQTQLAELFAGVTSRTSPWGLWNNVAAGVAMDRGLDLLETARLFVLLNAAIHDGLLTTVTSKFVYHLWRPVTAIQRADEDLNAATDPEAGWLPLLGTPPYPAYAGNMACVGAASARTLANVLGDNDIPFTVRWAGSTGNPDVERNYAGFWQLAQDAERSRVWGGIHYTFDGVASQEVCPKVADWVFTQFVQPARRGTDD